MPMQIIDPVALRIATLDHIRAHPEDHEQEAWRCNTGMCFAGTATVLAGGTFPYPATSIGTFASIVDTPGGRLLQIEEWATELLADNDEAAADVLFAGGNTLPELEHMVARLNHGLPLTDPDGTALAYCAEDWADLPDAPLDDDGNPILTPPLDLSDDFTEGAGTV